jgi:hypothetical protein
LLLATFTLNQGMRHFLLLFLMSIGFFGLGACNLVESEPNESPFPGVVGNGDSYSGIQPVDPSDPGAAFPNMPVLFADVLTFFTSKTFHADFAVGNINIPDTIVRAPEDITDFDIIGDFEILSVNQLPGPISIETTYTFSSNGVPLSNSLRGESIYPPANRKGLAFLGTRLRYDQIVFEICVNGKESLHEVGMSNISNIDPDPSNNCNTKIFNVVAP